MRGNGGFVPVLASAGAGPQGIFYGVDTEVDSQRKQDDHSDGLEDGLEHRVEQVAKKVVTPEKNKRQEDNVACAGANSAGERMAPTALPKCIRAVHQGQIWANNSQIEFLLQLITNVKLIHPGRRGLNTVLTPRQREVLKLVTEDMKNHDIALELGLTEHTVRNYIFQIFEKLGVSTRVGLVLYALAEPAINEKPPAL